MARLGPIAFVVSAFVLARAIAFAAGVRFDADQLSWGWHLLDPAWLRSDLLGSLLHLHSQPPLFNALVGLVLLVFPGHETWAFQALYWAFGLAFAIAGQALLVRLGVGAWLAAALVTLFVASPATLLMENWLMYTYPVAMLLCLAALALHRFMVSGRAFDGLAFFTCLALVCLTRSLFHLGWMVLAAAAIALAWRHDPRRLRVVALSFVLPGLVVFGLYAKNAALFGSFSASTWMGLSFYKVSTVQLGPGAIERLIATERLSPLARTGPFQGLGAYPASYTRVSPRGVRAVDAPLKADGTPNFNHLAYIGLSRQYLADGKAALAHRPAIYPKALAQALLVYFRPANDYGFFGKNRPRLAGWEEAYNRMLYGRWLPRAWLADPDVRTDRRARLKAELARVGWLLVAAFPALVLFGLAFARRRWRAEPATAMVVLFMCANILYVFVVGNGLEIGENNRFRFVTDFFYHALLALAIQAALGRRRSGEAPDAEPAR